MEGMAVLRGENVMVRLQPDVIQAIDERYKIEGFKSRSEYIRSAIEKFMKDDVFLIEFTSKELSDIKRAISKNGLNSVEDYVKEAVQTYVKRDLIREIVDGAICDVLKDPSRKEDLRDIVSELVNEEMRKKFSL